MPTSRMMTANGIDMFVTEQGSGPLVLLCHGWPELSYSWRRQLPALAAAGYRAVAPDMRGFGRTSAPLDIDAYSIFGDVQAGYFHGGRRIERAAAMARPRTSP